VARKIKFMPLKPSHNSAFPFNLFTGYNRKKDKLVFWNSSYNNQ